MVHIGIGSFAYRYSVGFPGCMPVSPMAAAEHLHSVVMESVIRRRPGADAEQAAREEESQVKRNAKFFLEFGKKYFNIDN